MTRREKQLSEIALKLVDAVPLAKSDSEKRVLKNVMTLVALEMKAEGHRAAKGRNRRLRSKLRIGGFATWKS